jgi:copper chaperone NosL
MKQIVSKRDPSPFIKGRNLFQAVCYMGVLLSVISSCGNDPEGSPKAVQIHLGEDVCSACGMIISDDRFGAQQHSKGQSPALFDDLGCLLKESSPKSVESIFVRSFENSSWIPASGAFAVKSKEIHSPMGYGIATFPTERAAQTYAARFQRATVHEIKSLLENPVMK